MPFLLQPQQDFLVGSIFGWIGADGWRRFREAYIETGKGSGKTPLLAGIGLGGAYGIYAAFAVISIVFIAKYVHETKGIELENMEG